ncbi:MAG: isocitrate dehydrogenase kinase/phosphatase AceK regulatory subunit, partial [Chloroflexota bacterium]
MNDLAIEIGTVIRAGFTTYHTQFKSITRRARRCFEEEDWHKTSQNAVDRLDVYTELVSRTVTDAIRLMEEYVQDQSLWMEIKKCYSEQIRNTIDEELAETFFNSISRRIFATIGVDETVEFVHTESIPYRLPNYETPKICRGYRPELYPSTVDLLWDLLNHSRFSKPIDNAIEAATMIASKIERDFPDYAQIDVIDAVFFRSKAAYIVGRILVPMADCAAEFTIHPVVIPLRSKEGLINVDAFLHSEDELSIIFSFAHTYFHVDTNMPGAVIAFLKSILPLKPLADLWISIGYNRHAKT